ncbi:hypothetical protein VC83_00500 [Pseudogymnoascus destructans]|uniref:Association with the SNF1 complex (ASC) domain-containing protein n=2 Tax=Pseudogymnoascus destructans TaxID=655981 RepID=L8GE27_PSED2|nr:uncharacterized protein VC83_00500 [Pseudogymnoascus destructans]ELR10411.1 hypothetical protein GMDG_00823 [Pseudogymnoascus destructans 20631-21]OAF63321.1 hypothetical protein VC83_00500 [Pseudogymnoascus destructans]
MGNNPSAPPKSSSASPAHGQSVGSASDRRREPKLRDTIQSQRGAAPPESSQVQARGTTVPHRTRNAQSQHAQFHNNGQYSHSPSPKENSIPSSTSASQPLPQQTPPSKPPLTLYDEPSKPVAVPQPVNAAVPATPSEKSPYSASQSDQSGLATDIMSYHLTRPPRLPLPIEEEVHTPGSPILGPASSQGPVSLHGSEGLARPLSALSNTTEDDEGDELPIDRTKPVVPTEFHWFGPAEKVYVTGTIFQWSRKSKLYPIPGKKDAFSAIIHVRPGTHHIRFIVDGNMLISSNLPTTVDFGNNLVNYIEVSADDLPKDSQAQGQAQQSKSQEGRQPREEAKPAEQGADAKQPRTKPVPPQEHYTSTVPQYLLDLDKAEDSPAYQYAASAIVKLPTPPSLPGFLGKPILNAQTPVKDDNSVLNMPNHTVLNHLATSSIKGNVLAVSATTRYKRKYVTTIMYKPTSDDTT